MNFFIETTHGRIVEVVRNLRQVMPTLKEMRQRGAIPKRVYIVENGKKKYLNFQ